MNELIKDKMIKIASTLIIIFITSTIINAQDSEWYTLVYGTIKLTGGHNFRHSSATFGDYPCNGCTDPSFNYSTTSDSKITSVMIGGGGQTFSGCDVAFISREVTSAGIDIQETFGSCTVGFKVTATFEYIPKLSISSDITPYNSTSGKLKFTVKGINAYIASYNSNSPLSFQVALDGTNNWKEVPLNYIEYNSYDTCKISFNNIQPQNENWVDKLLKIRLVQKINNNNNYSDLKTFKFLEDLKIEEPVLTPDCPSTPGGEGTVKITLINGYKKNNDYPMCVTLYKIEENGTCENPTVLPIDGFVRCKGPVIAQGPSHKVNELDTDEATDGLQTESTYKLTDTKIINGTYILEVYNGRFRFPAYRIITINNNDLNGVVDAIPKLGTSKYHISSCNPAEKIDVTINVSNSYGYTNVITKTWGSGINEVSFTDDSGCTASTSVTIEAPPAFSFEKIERTDVTCNGGKDGSIKCTTKGGAPPYTYSVTASRFAYSKKTTENTDTIATLGEALYNVTITDATGCLKNASNVVNIIQPKPLVFKGEAATSTCFEKEDGSITFSPGGGTPDYTLTVKNRSGIQVGSSFDGIIVKTKGDLKGGDTYTVNIEDKNKCEADTSIIIPNPPKITIDNITELEKASCAGVENGEASFTISNLKGNKITFTNNAGVIKNISGNTYSWTGLGIGESPKIKVNDGLCESDPFSVTITQKTPSVSATPYPFPADCENNHNGKVIITVKDGEAVSNGFKYSITDEVGKIIEDIKYNESDTFINLEGNKTYTIRVTDGLGCSTGNKSAYIGLDPYRIQLNTPNSENTFCSANPSGKISVSRLSGSGYGDITYSLLDGDAIGTGDNDNYTFSGLVPGKYTVQALDNSNSCYATKTVDVIANPNPISIIFSDTIHQSCNEVTNGQMRITASSIGPNNSNYGIESIYNGTLNVKTESNTILYQNQEAVTYNFTVVDKNKCTATGAFQIKNLHNNPTLKVNSIDSLYCPNDKTGVIRFKLSQKWRKPAYKFYLNGVLNPTDSIFNNRSSKNDTILVVDADGCPGDTIMNVPVLANTIRFNPNPYFTHASCMAAKNGTITVKADKGFPFENGNYKYSINTGETVLGKVAVFDSLEAGKDYVVSVSDAKDCILTYDQIPIRIIDNPLALSSPNTTNATCIEKATGRMIVSRLYGTPFKKGFKFDINDSTGTTVSTQNSGFSNVLFTGLKQGRYNVVVSDTNKCSVSQPFTIGYNPLFEVNSVKPFRVPKFGTRGGMVRAVASLGNAGFDYKFFQTGINGSTSAVLLRSGTMKDTVNIRNLYTGTYIIHIKDTADCVIDENTGNMWFIDTVLVSQPESELALQVSSLKNVACYGDSTASIQLSAQGGYPEYRYAIKEKVNFQREPLFGHLPIGTYELFVRDDADIDTSILVTVTQPSSPLSPSLAGTNRTSCFNYADGKASLSITGGTSPYTVSLDSVRWQSDPVLVGLKANKYTALVKDANNCFARLPNIMVTQPDSIAVSSQTITSTPCLKNEGAINVTGVTGGNGDYSYVWYKKDSVLGNQSILSKLYSGRYKLRITDKDGCKGDTAFFVSDISNIWVNFNTTPINCWGKANGKAELTVVKGALPITSVQWPGKPISMFATTELDSGLHRVVITDNERCQKDTTFTINTISRLSIPEVWRNNPLCLGRSDGSLRVEAAGGNPGYSYNWGKYGSRNEITDLLPGIYNVSVTDANNCVRAFDLTLDYQKVEKPRLGRDLVLCRRSDYILNPGNYLQYNWTLNNKAISTDSVFVVTQPGTYVVNVKSDEQCLGSDTLNVDFSNEELVSDFLMTTQAYAGDTIMLVEISRPIPDSVTWVLSTGCKLIDYGQYFKQISLPGTGIYKYAMIAHYKGCSDMVEKYVEVISPDGSVSKKKSATDDLFNSVSVYPNPSSGQFTVEVVLKRKSDLLMKIINLGTGITKYIRSSKGSDVYTENFSLNLTPGMHVLYLQARKSSRTVNIMVR